MVVALDADVGEDVADEGQALEVLLHLGLEPDVWVHAALLQVGQQVLDEHLQGVVNFGILAQLVGLLVLQYCLEDIGDGLHALSTQFHLGLVLCAEVPLQTLVDFVELLDGRYERLQINRCTHIIVSKSLQHFQGEGVYLADFFLDDPVLQDLRYLFLRLSSGESELQLVQAAVERDDFLDQYAQPGGQLLIFLGVDFVLVDEGGADCAEDVVELVIR